MNRAQLERVMNFVEKPVPMAFLCVGGAASIVAGIAIGFYLVARLVFWTQGRIFFP